MLSGNLYFQTVRSTEGKVEETLPFPSATTSKVVPFPLHLRANLFLFPAELRANLFPFPAELRARSTRIFLGGLFLFTGAPNEKEYNMECLSFDENYLEMKAPGIYRNIPDFDTTVETNTIDSDVGQENDVFKCKICFIYFSLSLSYKYYIHV